METVKFGQTKVKVGDCMSVPKSYFGTTHQQALTAAGIADEKVFGWVTNVVDGNQYFGIKWGLNGQTTMSLNKVQYESASSLQSLQRTLKGWQVI